MKGRVVAYTLVAAGMWLVAGCIGSGSGCCPHAATSTIQPTGPGVLPTSRVPQPPPTPGAPRPTACELLTPAQVGEALDTDEVTAVVDEDGRACLFLRPDSQRVLTVRVRDLPSALIGDADRVARLTAAPQAETEPVTGVGDAAYFYSDATSNGLAFARGHGDRVTSVDINAAGPRAHPPREALVKLGRSALNALR
ncbi:hypothetical protein [Yinghuangia seranimata]|uniref:hypothetical protein n=1 Tax=Yinghuangia seranimata TaxID=408067 RepID=UPI00248BC3F4|nr:hypothetical protein [Yinghuangia seranimata]MDI2128285.1 hypothetical protein [Yinghuangia seranimata]